VLYASLGFVMVTPRARLAALDLLGGVALAALAAARTSQGDGEVSGVKAVVMAGGEGTRSGR
jgi:hypothetical protein